MVAHLVWQDVKRNLRPIRALPVLALAIYFAHDDIKWYDGLEDSQPYLYFAEGAFSQNDYWLLTVIPLIAGVMGASLAAERRAGITLSILAKGVTVQRYVLAKMLGAAASSVIVTCGSIVFFFAYVFTNWTPGRAYPYSYPDPYLAWIQGTVKSLFIASPFAHDLLCVAMHLATAAALPLIGVLAGLLVANEYVAMAATPIFTIIAIVITRQVNGRFSPENFFGLSHYSDWFTMPDWVLIIAPFVYWTLFSLLVAALIRFIASHKEIA